MAKSKNTLVWNHYGLTPKGRKCAELLMPAAMELARAARRYETPQTVLASVMSEALWQIYDLPKLSLKDPRRRYPVWESE